MKNARKQSWIPTRYNIFFSLKSFPRERPSICRHKYRFMNIKRQRKKEESFFFLLDLILLQIHHFILAFANIWTFRLSVVIDLFTGHRLNWRDTMPMVCVCVCRFIFYKYLNISVLLLFTDNKMCDYCVASELLSSFALVTFFFNFCLYFFFFIALRFFSSHRIMDHLDWHQWMFCMHLNKLYGFNYKIIFFFIHSPCVCFDHPKRLIE